MTVIKSCKELSCIYNLKGKCPLGSIHLSEDGYCDV